jgi:hypothetical protein
MNIQCWICPKCHDDHRQDGACSPPSGEFLPAPDDRSYIAEAYRNVMAELTVARKCVSEIRSCTDDHEHGGDWDSCSWCELIEEYDDTRKARD